MLRPPPRPTLFPYTTLFRSWWRQPGELGLKLTASSASAAGVVAREDGFGMKALVEYRWELAVGDYRLTAEELAELAAARSEEHTSELQSRFDLVCRLLLEKK